MPLDTRVAQTTLENLLRDTVLYALGARVAQQPDVATLRTLVSVGTSGGTQRLDDDLVTVAGAPVLAYRWSSVSTAVDNGTTVIKPNDAGASGRWLAWTSPLRFSTVVGAASVTLDQVTSGPLVRVYVLDKNVSDDEFDALVQGLTPSVFIEADGDEPEDMGLSTGYRWDTRYHFLVGVVAANQRDRREAAQGSTVPNDPDSLGANGIDGFIKALLSGTQLHAVCDGIRNVQVGGGKNASSRFGQRRVVRVRSYTLQVTEENPAAPNDTGVETDVFAQAKLASPPDASTWPQPPSNPQLPPTSLPFDPANYVNAPGISVTVATGLMQPVSAGTAVIAGLTVNYSGSAGVAFTASSDTYRDLLPNGSLVFVTVQVGAPAPAVTATALRIGVSRTDGSGVVADRYIASTEQVYGANNDVPV